MNFVNVYYIISIKLLKFIGISIWKGTISFWEYGVVMISCGGLREFGLVSFGLEAILNRLEFI